MLKLNRILYPTDFSESSAVAVPHALDLAERYKAELHCLHVVDTAYRELVNHGYSLPMSPMPTINHSEVVQSAHKKLDTFVNTFMSQAAGNMVKEVVEGKPFIEIIRYAKTHEIDLIVMGTHGHSALGAMLLGSVTEKVVRKSPCAVLTVRHPKHKFEMP